MLRSFVIVSLFLGAFFRSVNTSVIFACDFEGDTMCGMNGGTAPVNFIVATGATVSDKALGPIVDHTVQNASGHFLYWYRAAPSLRVRIDGIINTPALPLIPNLCLNFAYYINSISTPDELTALGVSLTGCSQGLLWSVKIIDSKGWQTVETRLPRDTCSMMLSFFVSSNATAGVSVSIDDILVNICTTTTTAIASTAAIDSSGIILLPSYFVLFAFLF